MKLLPKKKHEEEVEKEEQRARDRLAKVLGAIEAGMRTLGDIAERKKKLEGEIEILERKKAGLS